MKADARGQMLVAGEDGMGDFDIAGIEILRHRHQRAGGDIGLDMETAEAIEAELAHDRAAGHQHVAGDLVSSTAR